MQQRILPFDGANLMSLLLGMRSLLAGITILPRLVITLFHFPRWSATFSTDQSNGTVKILGMSHVLQQLNAPKQIILLGKLS
jgi:hypothetical protein